MPRKPRAGIVRSGEEPTPGPKRPAKIGSPFRELGLFGLDALAPVLIAALATEEPLLLIGPHGTAKSLLLTRIATALGLPFRHYNASLINFDDLIGFPLPGPDNRLDYVRTPATIWGAGAVIFDEISRCRPDIQNKLFPIIHERRAQGLELSGLRYRWAAMNPPSTEDDDNGYLGSEPLDVALADRFAFVVEMPSWAGLTEDDQLAIIEASDRPVDPGAARSLVSLTARARSGLPPIRETMAEGVASYVRTLVALLAQANVHLSPRRAGMLFRSVLAVHAASLALDASITPSDSALLAVRNGLPLRAQNIPVPETRLLAAHREAWRFASIKPSDPLRAILSTSDPVERLRLAVSAGNLPRGEFSGIVADALATMQPGQKDAAVVHLFETGAVGRLNAAVAEQAGELYRTIATPPVFSETLRGSSPRFRTWNCIKDLLSRLAPGDERAHLHANALAASFAREELKSPDEAVEFSRAYAATDAAFTGVAP